MPTLHDMLHDSITTRTSHLAHTQPSDLPDTTTRITRIRRTRTASAVAAFAVLLAGAASLPVTGAELFAPAAPTPGDIAYVEVPLSRSADDPALDPLGAMCGQAIETVTESQGFTLEPTVTVETTGGVERVRAENVVVSYSGPTYTDAWLTRAIVALTKDGVVVGFSGFPSGFNIPSIGDGWEFDARAVMDYTDSYPWRCNPEPITDTSDPITMWDAGEYQAYVVVTINRTAELLAFQELQQRGYVLGDPLFGSFQPGSVDCQQAIEWNQEDPSMAMPVQCEPFGVPGVTLDKVTGTATLPYTVPQGEGDLTVRLVSKPVALTYEQILFWTSVTRDQYTITVDQASEADAMRVVTSQRSGLIEAETSANNLDLLRDPEGFGVTFDLRAVSSGILELPETMEAWISGTDGTIVGTAVARIQPQGPIIQDRTTGYGNFKVVLEDLDVDSEFLGGYLADPERALSTGNIILVGRFGATLDGGEMLYEQGFEIYMEN